MHEVLGAHMAEPFKYDRIGFNLIDKTCFHLKPIRKLDFSCTCYCHI